MKVLFDLNVVLDLLLDRSPWVDDAKLLVGAALAGKLDGFVCATSFPTLFYIARKTVGSANALVAVQRCLATFEVAAVDGKVLKLASELAGNDYEDNVQIAAAVGAALDVIITRDPAGFSGAPMLVLSPPQLIAQLGLQ